MAPRTENPATPAPIERTQPAESPKVSPTTAASGRMQNETIEPSNRNLWKPPATGANTDQYLPNTVIDSSGSPAPATKPGDATSPANAPQSALNAETVKKYSHELYEAINGKKPDNDKIQHILGSLSAADRKAIEDAYKNTEGNTDKRDIRTELKDRLGEDDFRKAEASLNKRDNYTNDAGNLMVALSAINDNGGDGERRVLETFSTLNAAQQEQLQKDFKQDYGKSVEEALKDFGVSEDAMTAMKFVGKPVEQRSAQDIKDFAKFALEKKSLDFFSLSLRGDTPEAVKARQELSSNEQFKKDIVEAFKVHQDGGTLGTLKRFVSAIPGGDVLVGAGNLIEGLVKGDLDFDRLTEGTNFDTLRKAIESKEVDSKLLQAMDILHNGQVSLATIAADNTGTIFGWFDNKDAISNAAEHATDAERQLFAKGQQLAQAGGEPQSEEDKNALAFYNSLHSAFAKAGNDNEPLKWEDRLLHGKDGSVISQILDSESKEDRYTAIESLSQKDWERLKDPAGGAAFRKQIEDQLNRSGNPEETAVLLKLLDKKLAVGSYEDSAKVLRSVSDLITTSPHSKTTVAVIAGITPEEAARYQTDAAFRAQVDKFLHENLDELGQVASSRLLAKIAATGKAPEQDAIDKLFSDKLNGKEGKDAITDIEAVLQDSALRQKLSGPEGTLNDTEKQLKLAIDEYINAATPELQVPAYGRGTVPTQPKDNEYLQALYQNGRLTVEQKAKLDLRGKDFFSQAATVSPEERQKLYDSGLVSADERKLIDTLTAQGGKMSLADELRAAVVKDGTDAEAFASQIKGLSPEDKQKLKNEYAQKYGSALEQDVLNHVSDQEKNNFRTYLTAGEVDGRQDFYDNLERALHSESGYSPDGSQEVLERALSNQGAMLSDFQARYEKLPPEKQAEANELFTSALKDYQESKEKFAENMFQAAVIVGGIAVGVATGGVGLAAMASVIAIGAVGRIALKKAIQGNDYDLTLSNCLKDAAIGGATAGLSVLGPETVAAVAGVGKAAASSFLTSAGEQVAANVIKKDASAVLERELNNIVSNSVVRGQPISKEALDGIVAKVASSSATAEEREALSAVLRTTLETSGRQISEDVMRASFTGMARQAAAFGTIGGTTNVAVDASVGLANGHFDPSHLPQSFLVGFGLGSGMSAGLETAIRGVSKYSTHDFNPTTTADGTPAPLRNGDEIVDGADVQLGQPQSRIAYEPLTPVPTRPGEPFVERGVENPLKLRYWANERSSFELTWDGSWYYPARTHGPTDSPVKIHIDVESPESLKRLQQVLIPALERDPELRRLIGTWKTFNPQDGIAPSESTVSKFGGGQGAKGFTIYPADVQSAWQAARKLDQILADNNLSLPQQIRHGNVDEVPKDFVSNRVGLTRDNWGRSCDSSAEAPIALLDPNLQARIEAEHGRKLNDEELKKVSERLVYDSDGKLGFKTGYGARDAYHGGVYLAESDRRVMYTLSERFKVKPLESAAMRESQLQASARVNGLPLTPDRVVGLGRSSDNYVHTGDSNLQVSSRHALLKFDRNGRFWIADANSKNGTWVNGKSIAPFLENGERNWRQVGPEDNIFLGNEPITLMRPNQRENFSFEPRNIEEYGSSPAFGRLVADAYGRLPQVERGLVERAGVRVVLGGDMGRLRPDLRQQPPGYPPGTTYASATGLYDQRARRLFVPEYIQQPNGRFKPHHDPEAALRHEFGHAVDDALSNFSRSREFVEALRRDAAEWAHAAPPASLQYYLNSPAEIFAELYASVRGGGLSNADFGGIAGYFKHASKVLTDRLSALK